MSNVEDWERRHALHPVVAYMFIGVAMVIGFLFLAGGTSQLWSLQKSKSWLRTTGVITKSDWIPTRGDGGYSDIAFRYSVSGRSYEGTNILPGANEYTTTEERAKVRQYPVGANVNVFYDPSDPENSCLEVGVVTRFPFILLALALFFIAGAGGFAWRIRRGRPIVFVGHGTEPSPVIEDYNLFPKDK